MLTNPVRAERKPISTLSIGSMSLRCCGRSPSGPPEEPAGNDMAAWRTSCSSTDKLGKETSTKSSANGLAVGCLDCSCWNESSDMGSGASSEQRIRIAARRLPSSSFDATACLNCADGSTERQRTGCTSKSGTDEPENDEIRLLIDDVKLCRLPPLFNGCKIEPPQLRREIQVAGSSALFETFLRRPARC